MTCLEHLIENTLTCIENKKGYENIMDNIRNDVNLECAGITPDQCWEICQYVYYVFIACGYEKTKHKEEIIKQLEEQISFTKKEVESSYDMIGYNLGVLDGLRNALWTVKNVFEGER